MSKVALVTDSTSTIPPEVSRGLPIFTIPLHLIWGDETYLDGINITPDEFYAKLKTAKTNPSTSQPSPKDFRDLYVRLLEENYDILTLTISSKLSGTYDSAIQAQASLPGEHIEVIDTLTSSLAMGFQVLAAARLATQGATLAEVKTVADKARKQSGIFFVLNTLEYLHRGGRIGGAQAFVGTVLNLKPILEVRDGRVEAVEKVRTSSKAIDKMLDLFEAKVKGAECPIRISTLYADTPDDAEILLERARQRFGLSDVGEAFISRVSPVLGVHTGPGALGLAYMTGM